MIDKLKKIFTECEVDFTEVNDHEIIVPCPVDTVPFAIWGKLSSDEILKHKDIGVYTDEGYIHITENSLGLDWFVEINDPYEPDDEDYSA